MECRFKLLEDGRTLSHCIIQKEPTLYPQMACTLSGYHIQKEPTLYLQMACTLSGYHIQMAITCIISMGKPLEDDRTLSDSNIHVIRALSFSPDEDNRTLSEYDIQKKTPIHLVLCLHVYIRISVKTLADETTTLIDVIRPLHVRPKFTTRRASPDKALAGKTISLDTEASNILYNIEAAVRDQRYVIFAGKQFAGRHLSDVDIQKEPTVYSIPNMSGGIQILVKTLPSKTITADVVASNAIDVVQARIPNKEGVQTIQQRLVLTSKQFEDGHISFRDNTQKETTIHMALRLCADITVVMEPQPPVIEFQTNLMPNPSIPSV